MSTAPAATATARKFIKLEFAKILAFFKAAALDKPILTWCDVGERDFVFNYFLE